MHRFAAVVLGICVAWGASAMPREQNIRPGLPPVAQNYLSDTLKALECMRMESGLWADKVLLAPNVNEGCAVQPLYGPTSPTNMALDLLIQLELVERQWNPILARRNIAKNLSALERADFHEPSGLFYNRYSPDRTLRVEEYLVSTVDNIHLALALWAVGEKFSGQKIGERAQKLFQRMDFSYFYDPTDGLFFGALRFKDEVWELEEWKYRYFGSEARTLYTLGYVLGLIKDPGFLEKAFENLQIEIFETDSGRVLGLWDGGAFQLLLPRLLVPEDQFSTSFQEFYSTFGKLVLEEQKSNHYILPAAFSACQYGVDSPNGCGDYPCYNGKVGLPSVVSTFHDEFKNPQFRRNWDRVISPHGVFLSAVSNPLGILSSLAQAESTQGNNKLYISGLGWLDGYHVREKEKGFIVPVILSLNHGMIALSLFQTLSLDNQTVASRMLSTHPEFQKRLRYYFSLVDGASKAPSRSLNLSIFKLN